MTVKDLIERLGNFPPDMLVLVTGYEDGYDHLYAKNIKMIKVQDHAKAHDWWSGRYQDASAWYTLPGKVALVLGRW